MANRLLLGFGIGISSWKIHHLLHGAVLGLLFSLSVSIGFLSNEWVSFFLYPSAGILYGVRTEWLSTDLLRAPMKATWLPAPPDFRCSGQGQSPLGGVAPRDSERNW